MTDASGVARVGSWILGSIPGPNSLSATVGGGTLPVVQFTATGIGVVPTSIAANGSAGNAQAALPGSAVATAPSVIVRGAGNQPVPGVSVTFSVTGGSGSLTGAVAVTDAGGIATVGSWTLGPDGGANCLAASVSEGGVSGNPVAFAATGIPPGGPGYDVQVQYLTCVTPAQEAVFANAAARWGTLITGDVPDLTVTVGAGTCGGNSPALTSRDLDDLLIFATIEPIDGPGAILGSAGPCFIRSTGNLPIIGRMRFDVADIANLEANGRLTDVILHEMGHVIGIGSLWSLFGFLQSPSPVGGPPLDTFHNGPNAVTGFDNIGGSTYTGGNKVPVENQFGGGTINVHWREGVLANELMTGFLNAGSNPLSELSVRSLQDFGYLVNPAAADPFFLALALREKGAGEPEVLIQLTNDVWMGPLYRIDRAGRIFPLR